MNIQDTEKRLVLNQSKLAIATPDHDKIKFLILQDQNVVEFYNKRIRFIEYSVYCEFLMYHSKKAKIIKSFEGLVNNELKHANEMRGIWTVLKECVLIVK